MPYLKTRNNFAERDYLVYENERITYQQHYQQVVALAHALITDLGISKGDRVALAMRNYPEWPVVIWHCLHRWGHRSPQCLVDDTGAGRAHPY